MLNSGKKISRFARQKKINILTFVLFEKKFLNEAKTITPCKLNGRSLTNLSLLYVSICQPLEEVRKPSNITKQSIC